MNFRVKLLLFSIASPCVLVLLLYLSLGKATWEETEASRSEQAKVNARRYTEVRDLILDHYAVELKPRDLLFNSLKGMTKALDYASFYTPDEEALFNEEITGEYIGIGLYLKRLDGRLVVYRTLFGSPASSMLARGDEILEVDGRSVKGLSVDEAYRWMRGSGEVGSPCRLKVRKASDKLLYEVTALRERIKKPSVFGERILGEGLGIGYIRVSHFLNQTDSEFEQILKGMDKKNLKSLILDLRFNAGGVLNSAVRIANFFIAEGVLVSIRGRNPESDQVIAAERKRFIWPVLNLVVLINGKSASAAEVLAGALQDHKRAVLVGSPTFGKGVVQSVFRKEMEGQPVLIKIPTAMYYLPSGRCIEKKLLGKDARGSGLEPDVVVPMPPDEERNIQRQLLELSLTFKAGTTGTSLEEDLLPDPQIEAAIRLLKGGAVLPPLSNSK